MLPPTMAELPQVLVKERGEETKTLCIGKIQNKKYRKIQNYNQQNTKNPHSLVKERRERGDKGIVQRRGEDAKA